MREDDLIICHCEGVHLLEIKAGTQAEASVTPNMKMRHRVGVGHCQGEVCQALIQ